VLIYINCISPHIGFGGIMREKVPDKRKILDHVLLVTGQLLKDTKSKKISIKLRTLLRYAYISYVRKTVNLSTIRGLVPRIRPPSRLTNQYFYRDVEDVLRRNFKVKIENKRNFRYVVLYKD